MGDYCWGEGIGKLQAIIAGDGVKCQAKIDLQISGNQTAISWTTGTGSMPGLRV